MTLSKSLVETFNATQLAQLARLTGTSTSNRTKAALASGIQNAATNASSTIAETPNPPLRILSIDIGIKNLAYCILSHTSTSSVPTIHSWRRISVLEPSATDIQDAYSTPELAQAASNFVHDVVLAHNPPPAHILIERQRWRTGGGPAILQWTVRVNSFEAMLWAALCALRQQGVWQGAVHAMNPAQIASLWLPKETTGAGVSMTDSDSGSGSGTGSSTMRKYQALKSAKVQLLRSWINDESVVRSGSAESEDIFAALRAEDLIRGSRGRKRVVGQATDSKKVAKLDDLADCLIQGVTWLYWRRNSRLLAERGLDGANELLLQPVPGFPGSVQ